MQSKTKSIKLITTRAITINLFLKDIVKKLGKKYDVTLICKDPKKLRLRKFKRKKINFPLKIKDFLNIKRIYYCFK